MEKKEVRLVRYRFVDRKSASEFAKAHDAKVERCPAVKENVDGYFKYMVHIEKSI